MVEKIQFNGIILDVYVCYKNYLCVHLLNEKEKISLSSFSCIKGDDIIKGDSLVKKNIIYSLLFIEKTALMIINY